MSMDLTITAVQTAIVSLPGRPPFMVAPTLASFYETDTRSVVQAVKRNPARFPEDFAFHLTREEANYLKSHNVIPKDYNYLPLVFTEAGALALSGVLESQRAAEVSVMIHRAFVALQRVPNGLRETVAKYALAAHPQWKRIIGYVRRGFSNAEVAKMLGCGPDWIRKQRREMEALGLIAPPADLDRRRAAVPALRSGLIH